MNLGRYISLLSLLIFSSVSILAQDVHFSQFYNSPLYLNPANTGSIQRGELRINALQRTQWKSVTKPFNSFFLSGDIEGPFKKKNLGLGLTLLNDIAGDSRFKTFSVQALIASGLQIGDGGQELRGGIQIGFTQQSLDAADLQYGAQYTGSIFDPQASSQELGNFNKVSHLDIGGGLEYIREKNDRNYQRIGISLYNLTAPAVGFIKDSPAKLDPRINAQIELSAKLSDDFDIVPSFQFMSQGTYKELLIGTRFRYVLRDDVMAFRRLYIGGFGRLKDAAYVQVGMDYDRWTFGLSYDVNLSSLEVASNNRGGLEIAVIYVIDLFREVREPHRKCPVYL